MIRIKTLRTQSYRLPSSPSHQRTPITECLLTVTHGLRDVINDGGQREHAIDADDVSLLRPRSQTLDLVVVDERPPDRHHYDVDTGGVRSDCFRNSVLLVNVRVTCNGRM